MKLFLALGLFLFTSLPVSAGSYAPMRVIVASVASTRCVGSWPWRTCTTTQYVCVYGEGKSGCRTDTVPPRNPFRVGECVEAKWNGNHLVDVAR